MAIHFPTVPVEQVPQESTPERGERLPPVILVVDDEPLIAETLAAILNGHGLAALTASDGPAALELAELIPPQMLLTDVALPGMNGFELAQEVICRIPECEVILFSGQYSTCDLVSTHDAAGRNFLTLVKPVHPVEMLARVFERLSVHGWPVPVGFPPPRPKPYDVFSPRSAAHREPPEREELSA